jgi:hypothetical protein
METAHLTGVSYYRLNKQKERNSAISRAAVCRATSTCWRRLNLCLAHTTRWGGGRQHRARHMEYVPAVRQALNLLPDLEVLQSKKRRRKFRTINDRERRKIRRDLAIHRSA